MVQNLLSLQLRPTLNGQTIGSHPRATIQVIFTATTQRRARRDPTYNQLPQWAAGGVLVG